MLKDREGSNMGAAIAYSAYRRSELETISPRDLLVRLFQGLERFIDQAALAIRNRRWELAHHSCSRAQAIVFELQSTLNFEDGGEVAVQLDQLYSFLTLQITEGNLRKDADKLSQLQRVIRPLREAWQAIPDKDAHLTSLTGDGHQNIINMRG